METVEKAAFRGGFFLSKFIMDAVDDRLEVGLRELELNKDTIKSLTGFPWITITLNAF